MSDPEPRDTSPQRGVSFVSAEHLPRFQSQAIESSISAIGFGDLQGRLTYVNPPFLRMWGYEDLSDVLGRHASEFAGSEQVASEVIASILEHGAWVGEVVAKRKNGEPFIVEMTSSLVRDAAGSPIGMMASFIDITERRRTEAALRESEEKYRSLVEAAQDVIFTADAVGRYLYVNPAAAAMLGTTPEHVIGRTVDELFPPDVAQRYRAGVQQVFETGKALVAENKSEINGQILWFSSILQPVRDQQGNIKVVQAVVRDITNLKRAEEALRESEERLRQVIRVSNIGIFDHDHGAQTIYRSPQMQHILDLDPEEPLSGNDFQAVRGGQPAGLKSIHPDDRERIAAAIERAHSEGDGLYDVEFRTLRRDGTIGWVAVRSQTFFEVDGDVRRPSRTIGAAQDITAEIEAEQERAKLQAQLIQAQKMESVGRLAGGVAHDFNNMLNVILGHAELALGRVDPSRPVHSDLVQIQSAAQRSADLTRQLLAFGRKQTVAPKVLNLNEVAAGALNMLRRLIGENINLIWSPGPDLWPVRIDPGQVDQILANLSANARDAIAGVGQITMRTENVVLDAAYCARHPGFSPGQHVMLEIADNGHGMDQETIAHIFEPFYTTKREGQGTGLGLSTVYGIVKQNDGFIHVESALGLGATVKIFLPRVTGEAIEVGTSGSVGAPRSGTETILLVEDEPMVLRFTKTLLERLGYRVWPAAAPSEAIRLVKEHDGRIDLLVTDVVMPEMNGRDLAARLISLYPHIKCLFVSGYPADTFSAAGVLDPEVHFLQKPFSAKDLAAKVREAIGRDPAGLAS